MRLLNLKSDHVSFEISVPNNVHLRNFDLSFPADSTNGSALVLKGNTNSLIFHRLAIKASKEDVRRPNKVVPTGSNAVCHHNAIQKTSIQIFNHLRPSGIRRGMSPHGSPSQNSHFQLHDFTAYLYGQL